MAAASHSENDPNIILLQVSLNSYLRNNLRISFESVLGALTHAYRRLMGQTFIRTSFTLSFIYVN